MADGTEAAEAAAKKLQEIQESLKEHGYSTLEDVYKTVSELTEQKEAEKRKADKFNTNNDEAQKIIQGHAAQIDVLKRESAKLKEEMEAIKTGKPVKTEGQTGSEPPATVPLEELASKLTDQQRQYIEQLVAETEKADPESYKDMLTERGKRKVIEAVLQNVETPDQKKSFFDGLIKTEEQKKPDRLDELLWKKIKRENFVPTGRSSGGAPSAGFWKAPDAKPNKDHRYTN